MKAELFGRFGYRSGRDFEKFSGVNYLTGKTGVPILTDDTIAWFECRVTQTVDTGTHILFIGDVINEELLDPTGEPYTYAYFRDVRKGKAPKNSPTYIDPKNLI
jgi:ferric-chelate reductase [NAD(P)H]